MRSPSRALAVLRTCALLVGGAAVLGASACAGAGAAPQTLEDALPASVAATLDTQTPPRIQASYTSGGLTLTLRNRQFDGDTRGASNVKFATDEDIRNLLAAWTRLGFFTQAGQSTRGNPRAVLMLRIDQRSWVLGRLAEEGQNKAQSFNHCIGAFQQVYNTTLSFQAVRNLDAKAFETENERKRREQAEILRSRGQK